MRVARLRMTRFRGFEDATLRPQEHVVLVGEPRAGRSDAIVGLTRVLDHRSTSARPDPLDVHQPAADEQLLTEVEVTLVDLGAELEQRFDQRLELIDLAFGDVVTQTEAAHGVLGLRLCYRLRYDERAGIGEHWVDYPKDSEPDYDSFARVARVDREALPFLSIDRSRPLQLRAEGRFRALVGELDTAGLSQALQAFQTEVADATDHLSASNPVREGVRHVMQQGADLLLEVTDAASDQTVGFVTEDGSVAGLLRAVQPSLNINAVGPLPLASHGSTAVATLAVAEALATAAVDGTVVVADDFGDDLDVAGAEYLAARLRVRAGQAWISTRRSDVVRAFPAEEIIRLTRSHGNRRHHQLQPTTDRKVRAARQQMQLLLLPAMTARAVGLLEGPHDLEGYSAVADRRLRASGTPPPAAHGVRLVAPIGDGGKAQLPRLARLASDLGFHVKVVLDHDKPGEDAALVAELASLAQLVIRLPERVAVERALVLGLPKANVRTGLSDISHTFGLAVDVDALAEDEVVEATVEALKQKGGLHRPYIDALPPAPAPPLAVEVLDRLVAPSPATGPFVELEAP
jgi:putative ATP-dependent endonuclease of OLD family